MIPGRRFPAMLFDWREYHPFQALTRLYEEVTGRAADQHAARRCAVAVILMMVPTWQPGRRMTDAQAAVVGQAYSWLLGDLRGARGNLGRWTVANQRRRVADLRDQLRRELGSGQRPGHQPTETPC